MAFNAFLDNAKKKFSEASADTKKKVNDFSETTKLNSEISGAENQIKNLYTEIGRRVYQAHSQDPLPEAADLIEQVNALQQKINECKQQIESITAGSICPQCGARLKKNVQFCGNCGCRIEIQKPQATAFCAGCGAPLQPGMAFCMSCGQPVAAAAPAAANNAYSPAVEVQADVMPQAPKAADVKVCPGCGAIINAADDIAFCKECGAKLK